MNEVLKTFINASERAARVARSCCSGSSEEALLIAEKGDGEANTRFDRDFKTIADVLAQEAARTEIASLFPEFADHVRGEECSEMGGVRITVGDSVDSTVELLRSLLPTAVAKRMAEAAHDNTQHELCDRLPDIFTSINVSDLGVWIDPIDSTAEFIAGVQGVNKPDRGLSCVTVLIGAYFRSTGEPVIGVINQPFFDKGKGRVLWGVSYGDTHEWGGTQNVEKPKGNVILMSGAEKTEIADKFRNFGWEVKSVPGAGHKLLKVALGEAEAYFVSQGTTFRWDTCAPHSILRAKGGDLVSYSTNIPITYNDTVGLEPQYYCNSEGIIAYTDESVLNNIKDILKH